MSESEKIKRTPGLGTRWYPDGDFTWFDRIKEIAWDIIFPVFPYLRDMLLALRFIRHEGRQRYHIGWLVSGKTPEAFRKHLKEEGFDVDRIAWIDDDEVINLRLRVSFKYQYHLRLFRDGELRGHYELTPECNPIAHLLETELSACTEDFFEFLDGWMEKEDHPK